MRKLASVQEIISLEPIQGADAIEVARVLGWKVVVKRGEFQPGERIVYCEIDSLLPERTEFEFLRASCFKPAQIDANGNVTLPAGFRVKTVKLRGQISQGICFPLTILGNGNVDIGCDVTSQLQVAKWEPPVPPGMVGRIKGSFPGFLPKTDETRVQLLEELLSKYRGATFYVTEKLDGTSFSAFYRQGEFGVCSRNQWLDESDQTSQLVKVAKELKLDEILRDFSSRLGFDIAIQGELIGPGIQKNRYGMPRLTLRVFNLINLNSGQLVDFQDFQVHSKGLGLETVPFLEKLELNHSIDELIQMAHGKSVLNSSVEREGIVLRPLVEEYSELIGARLSFKVINPKFLLKYDE